MSSQEAIPEAVLDGLEEVRADGQYNMLDYNGVVREMLGRADAGEWPVGIDEGEYRRGISWLVDNDARYMEALKAMGKRRKVSR